MEKEPIKEVPEEGAGGKPEYTLEMHDEDNVFSVLGIRSDLWAG